MSQFTVNTAELIRNAGQLEQCGKKLLSYESSIKRTRTDSGIVARSYSAAIARLAKIEDRVSEQSADALRMAACLRTASQIYADTENELSGKSANIAGTVIAGAGAAVSALGELLDGVKVDVDDKIKEQKKYKEWGNKKYKEEKEKTKPEVELVFAERKFLDKTGAAYSKSGGVSGVLGTVDGEIEAFKYELTGKAKISNKGAEVSVGAGVSMLAATTTAQTVLGETSVSADVLSAEAKGKVKASLEDGGTLVAEGSAGAYIGKGKVSHKGSICGIEITAEASANVGAGVKGKIGYENGVFTIGAGATLGVGADASISINIGKTLKKWGNGIKNRFGF